MITSLGRTERSEIGPVVGAEMSNQQKDLLLAHFRRRFLDIYQHRPRQLFLAINGIEVASLDIASQKNELRVSTGLPEPLEFVEIFSEQNIRLAMLNFDRNFGDAESRQANISLSDGRRLKMRVKEIPSGVSIQLSYNDPDIEGWEIFEAKGLLCPVITE